MAADAITRVGQWLRSTVPGDLARVVGTGDGVATDDVAAVLDALDAAQRSAARADAAEACIADVGAALGIGRGAAPRVVVAEAEELVERCNEWVDRAFDGQRIARDAMAAGLAECERLRGEVAAITDAIGCDEGTPVATVVEMAGGWVSAVKILMEKLDRRDRALAGDATGGEGACLLVEAVLRSAVGAPNFAQWHGDYAGRTYLLTVQWAAGKTPAELISAAIADRDAAVARCTALAGAARHERAIRAAWLATLPPCATAPAEVLAAEAATGAALDALLTEGTRSVADEAECDDCGDDMASGYFDPMARCPRHRP